MLAAALLSGAAAIAADTAPPELKALRLNPPVIDTSTGPAEVTLELTVDDDDSGVSYFEASLVDPTGTFRQSASGWIGKSRTEALSTTIAFPQFSASGAWTLSNVLLSDAAGNTLVLDADELSRRGLLARLEVRSASDSQGPRLKSLEFSPARIDTTLEPADVTVTLAATDDISGVNYVELAFTSPSGVGRHGNTVRMEASRSVSTSMTLTFPRRSEQGLWTLSSVFLSDAANNTLVLDSEALAGLRLARSLEVISAADTDAPRLTSLQFSPYQIDTSAGPASVEVVFHANDNLAGVKSLEVVFDSPSGVSKQRASAEFPALGTVEQSLKVSFPHLSEPGDWNLSGVLLEDAAGNTLALDADGIRAMGVRTGLNMKSASDTSPPQLAALGFAPEEIDTTQGPAVVRVAFVANDISTGVQSVEVGFVNPSGSARVRGAAELRASADAKGVIRVIFPQGSEPGIWRMETALLADAAGNTLLLDAGELASRVGLLRVR